MAEEWDILDRVEMVCHDSAANMLGVYNISDFPSHCIAGRCVNHILQLYIQVGITYFLTLVWYFLRSLHNKFIKLHRIVLS